MKRTLLTASMLCAALLLGACNAPVAPTTPAAPVVATVQAPETKEKLVLRSYDVPEPMRDRFIGMLRSLRMAGTVTPGPGNRVLVMTTEQLQDDIKALLETFDDKSAQEARPQRLVFDYWFMLGHSGKDNGQEFAALAPALKEIVKAQGPTHFAQVEHLNLASQDGSWAELTGRHTSIKHSATTIGQDIFAEMQIRLRDTPTALETKARLDPNGWTILGQSGIEPEIARQVLGAVVDADNAQLFIIVKARVQ